MSRFGRLFRSRIALALLGMALVGGGGAYWAVTSGAHSTPQASNSLTNTDPTSTASTASTASAENPTETTTTDPRATATATTIRNTPTPHPTATPCLATPTPNPITQTFQWQGRVSSKGTSTFVLRVSCSRPAIAYDSNTAWTGSVTSFAALQTGATAVVEVKATRQSNGSYLAVSVNAQNNN